MNYIKLPTEQDVLQAIEHDEPLLLLIAFDGSEVIMSHLDYGVEHHILLSKANRPAGDLDKYYRIILDRSGADWTFICPENYKGITDRTKRISEFYKNGFATISAVLERLGYLVGINIPKRYQRHIKALYNEDRGQRICHENLRFCTKHSRPPITRIIKKLLNCGNAAPDMLDTF